MSDERTATANDARIGLNIRKRRLEIGMSQERLAELLGVTFQQVQKYEKGVNRTATSRLIDIAAALGCTLELLVEGCAPTIRGAMPAGVDGIAVSASLATAEGMALASRFATVKSPPLRRRIVALVDAIAEAGAAQ
ncbi:MAG TPA: helix-turn-helix transcriptional regulator [Terricaulis sp.]|nr:helix-turn-helix transcriptional regulator [Terricaulis sp.]